MQRWEYLLVIDSNVTNDGYIRPASHRLEQMYQHLQGCLPNLGPKDLKISSRIIRFPSFLLADVMNILAPMDGKW